MSDIAVAVRTASLRPEIGEVALAKMVGAIEKSWGKRAEYTPIVPLFLADGQWTGTILDQKGQQQRLGYDSFSGLDVQKSAMP